MVLMHAGWKRWQGTLSAARRCVRMHRTPAPVSFSARPAVVNAQVSTVARAMRVDAEKYAPTSAGASATAAGGAGGSSSPATVVFIPTKEIVALGSR